MFILLSTTCFILNTLPEFKLKIFLNNSTNHDNSSKPDDNDYILVDNPIFELIESVCVTLFTIEFLLRFWSSPNKKTFLQNFLNIIDLITIIPYYIAFFSFGSYSHSFEKVLLLFRILRIFRILKLSRYSASLQSLGVTLRKSRGALVSLFLFLCITVILFSSFLYYIECEQLGTKFTSIPASFW